MSDFEERSLLKKILYAPFGVLRWLVSLLTDLTEIFERLTQRLTRWLRNKTDADDGYDLPPTQTGSLRRVFQLAWLSKLFTLPLRIFQWMFGGVVEVTETIDRRFQGMVERTDHLGQSVAQADSALLRLFRVLRSPFEWFWFRVLAPVGRMFSLGGSFEKIGSATWWLWYPIAALISFLRTLVQTRRAGLLVWTVPLIVLLGGISIAVWVLYPRTGDVSKKYREAIDQAIAKGEYHQAQLYQEKLKSLGVRHNQDEIRQIEELTKLGRIDEAIAMAERLAPIDRPGFPEAHFWLAQLYLEEKGHLQGKASLERADLHLKLLAQALKEIRVETLPPNVTLMAAMLEFKKKNPKDGLSLLKSVSGRYWPALVFQMEVHANLGQTKEVVEDALAISQLVKKEPGVLAEVTREFFPMWCSALSAARETDDLKSAVLHWVEKYPNDPQAIAAWAKMQLSEIDTLMIRGSESDLSRAVRILVQATNRLDLDQHELIASWLYVKLPPSSNLPNYQRLTELAAKSEDASSLLLEVLGTAAAMRNDNVAARELLTRAAAKDANNVVALNNLAYIISLHFVDEMPLALELAEKAFRVDPDDIRIMHTRGFIYLRLQRWEPAIKDLRAVIARNPDAADVHRGLAEAYRKTGRAELAALHETQAN